LTVSTRRLQSGPKPSQSFWAGKLSLLYLLEISAKSNCTWKQQI